MVFGELKDFVFSLQESVFGFAVHPTGCGSGAVYG
jgi:hypothetical protein